MKALHIVLCCWLTTLLHAGAAPFQNLDFEAANTNNVVSLGVDGFAGTTCDLLPSWQFVYPPLDPSLCHGFGLNAFAVSERHHAAVNLQFHGVTKRKKLNLTNAKRDRASLNDGLRHIRGT